MLPCHLNHGTCACTLSNLHLIRLQGSADPKTFCQGFRVSRQPLCPYRPHSSVSQVKVTLKSSHGVIICMSTCLVSFFMRTSSACVPLSEWICVECAWYNLGQWMEPWVQQCTLRGFCWWWTRLTLVALRSVLHGMKNSTESPSNP